jgi:phosphate-selective porin OprO/OprP
MPVQQDGSYDSLVLKKLQTVVRKLTHLRRCKRLVSLSFFSACLWGQSPFQIHGYIQGRFTNQEGTPDRLEIRRARVNVSGEAFSNLSYTFQVDLVQLPYLLDAAVTWKILPSLRVTGGQFKIPFSAESLVSDRDEIPIARSRAVNGLAPGRDTGVQGRDVGLQIAGEVGHKHQPLLEYATGVFRGQTFVYAPNSHYPAVAVRVMLHPLRQLTVGGDWYSSFSAPSKAEKRRHEVEGSYARERLLLRTEQIWARDGTLERHGGYLLGAWQLSPRWEPLARADWLTTNIHKSNTTSIAYLTGVNFRCGKHFKIGANAGAQYDQKSNNFASLFLAQTMLGF